jgi:branched-chain amino acid transport system substrate-binding protein
MKRIRSLLCASCVLLLFVSFPFSGAFGEKPADQKETLKIGAIVSLTGPFGAALKDVADAAEPIAGVLNKRGGVTVKGQKYLVEIVTADDQSSPPGAVAAYNKLLQEKIKFMIPPFFIPSALAVVPLMKEAKIVSMKPFLTVREIVNRDLPYSFASSTFFYNTPSSYDYLKKHYPKIKKIAIIAPDDPGMGAFDKLAKNEIQKGGLDVVFDERFNIGSEDFYPILTKALEKKPDAIDMLASIEPWSAGIINQSRELGFRGPIFTSTAMLGDINLLKGMIDPKYAYDLFQPDGDALSPKMPAIVKEFRAAVEQKTGKAVKSSQVAVLDAVYVLLQGIGKAQSFDADKVAQALEGMKSVETVNGKGRMAGEDFFGVNHVVRRPIAISGITNGKVWSELTNRD